MMTKTSTCRKCGKPIKFIRTTNGKWLPVNPAAVYYSLLGNKDRVVTFANGFSFVGAGNYSLLGNKDLVVTADGRIVACTIVDAVTGCVGFIPHWATCEYANDFRREKKSQEHEKSNKLTGFEAVALF